MFNRWIITMNFTEVWNQIVIFYHSNSVVVKLHSVVLKNVHDCPYTWVMGCPCEQLCPHMLPWHIWWLWKIWFTLKFPFSTQFENTWPRSYESAVTNHAKQNLYGIADAHSISLSGHLYTSVWALTLLIETKILALSTTVKWRKAYIQFIQKVSSPFMCQYGHCIRQVQYWKFQYQPGFWIILPLSPHFTIACIAKQMFMNAIINQSQWDLQHLLLQVFALVWKEMKKYTFSSFHIALRVWSMLMIPISIGSGTMWREGYTFGFRFFGYHSCVQASKCI